MIERTIYISDIDHLKFCTEPYTRLYFGAEFCDNLLPSSDDIKQVLNFCINRNINFTLVLPWCQERSVPYAIEALESLPKATEVVFNDWGIWTLMQEKFKNKEFKCVLGRLLNKTRSDPRAQYLTEQKDSNYTKACILDNAEFQSFITNRGIYQVDLSNTLQGYSYHLDHNISASIYYPYVFSSIIGHCLFTKDLHARKCGHECKKKYYVCRIKKELFDITMFIQGNYEFYKNDTLPSETILSEWNVNRTVFLPRLTY